MTEHEQIIAKSVEMLQEEKDPVFAKQIYTLIWLHQNKNK